MVTVLIDRELGVFYLCFVYEKVWGLFLNDNCLLNSESINNYPLRPFFTNHPQNEVLSNSKIAIPPGRCILINTFLSWKPLMLYKYLQMMYNYNQWHLLIHLIYRKCMISKELWYLVILTLVYPNIFQITPRDDNYLLYFWLGENKWQYIGLYDILQEPVMSLLSPNTNLWCLYYHLTPTCDVSAIT